MRFKFQQLLMEFLFVEIEIFISFARGDLQIPRNL